MSGSCRGDASENGATTTWLGRSALLLALGSAVAAMLAGFGSRLGWWHFRTGFQILIWAAYGGLGGAAIGLVGCVVALWRRPRRRTWIALVGVLVGLVVAGCPGRCSGPRNGYRLFTTSRRILRIRLALSTLYPCESMPPILRTMAVWTLPRSDDWSMKIRNLQIIAWARTTLEKYTFSHGPHTPILGWFQSLQGSIKRKARE